WRRLHRLVYVIAILGLLHYFWLVKVGVRGPYYYALWLAPLLAVRIGDTLRRARARARRGDPEAVLVSPPPRPAPPAGRAPPLPPRAPLCYRDLYLDR